MIVFDTETTGLPKAENAPLELQPKIIEFAAIKLDHDVKELGRIDFLINPEMPIPKEATAINKITDDDVKSELPFVARYNELCNFFVGETDLYAHNIAFDIQMIIYELRRLGYEHKFPYPQNNHCTVELSRPLLQTEDAPRSLRQVDLFYHAFEKKYDAHRAMNDVEALVEYIRWMRKNYLL